MPSKSAPAKQKRKIDDNRALRAEGDNLAPFLYALKATAPGAYRRIVEAVRSVAPFFDDFFLAPDTVNPDVIQLAWRHRTEDVLFTADSLSDGTLRFICLATLLCQPELPSLIIIDEPEFGLHPFAIAQLAALVRAAASKAQVLLATQSVTLLDQFDASEVIVAERSNGGCMGCRSRRRALLAMPPSVPRPGLGAGGEGYQSPPKSPLPKSPPPSKPESLSPPNQLSPLSSLDEPELPSSLTACVVSSPSDQLPSSRVDSTIVGPSWMPGSSR